MKKIIFLIGKLLSCIYCYKLNQVIIKLNRKLYSGWISNKFNHFDMTAVINSPFRLQGSKYISIGKKTSIGKHGELAAIDKYKYMNDKFNPQIHIGSNVDIGEYCHITAINKIIIGDGVLTGKNTTITDNAHGKINSETFLLPPALRPLYSPGPVIIDDNVWI
jgi:acetyltransferase-like isoleucine patch superfamily enzyme